MATSSRVTLTEKELTAIIAAAVAQALAQASPAKAKAASAPKKDKFLGKAARNAMRTACKAKPYSATFSGKMADQSPACKAAARKWLKANGYAMSSAKALGF